MHPKKLGASIECMYILWPIWRPSTSDYVYNRVLHCRATAPATRPPRTCGPPAPINISVCHCEPFVLPATTASIWHALTCTHTVPRWTGLESEIQLRNWRFFLWVHRTGAFVSMEKRVWWMSMLSLRQDCFVATPCDLRNLTRNLTPFQNGNNVPNMILN